MSNKPINDGGSAFPVGQHFNANGDPILLAQPGMSLRAYLAGQAMMGDFASNNQFNLTAGPKNWVAAADALIKALEESE